MPENRATVPKEAYYSGGVAATHAPTTTNVVTGEINPRFGKCLCGKCKTCANRRYSAKWRANHPGPKHLSRVRRNGVAVGKTPWANLRGDTTERAIVASAAANHYPGRFAEWSKRRIAELRCKWRAIGVG